MSEASWLETHIEDEALRLNPALQTFKTPEALAKSYIETKSMQGRSLLLPGEEATPEQWLAFDAKLMEKTPGLVRMPEAANEDDSKRFWGQLGVPEEIKGYTKPEDFEGIDDAIVGDIARMAHEAGLTNTQFQGMLGQLAASAATLSEGQAAAIEEAEDALKKEWGPKYADNKLIAAELGKKVNNGLPVENMGIDEQKRMVALAEALSSDPQSFAQAAKPSPRRTVSELEQDISELRVKLRDKKITGQPRKLLVKKFDNLFVELAEHK